MNDDNNINNMPNDRNNISNTGNCSVEEKYADIIGLPHPVSRNHPQMSMQNRAAQFAPFAALNGFEQAILDTANSSMITSAKNTMSPKCDLSDDDEIDY